MRPTLRTTDIVTRLDLETLALLEHGFATDLKQVRLRIRMDSKSLAPFAIADEVVMGEDWYRPETATGRRILAHEVAHLLQKRNGRMGAPRSDVAALEEEANAASLAVASGQRFECRLADGFTPVRHWEVAGHYYTVYMILLAAGVNPDLALKLATWAQMPDQVNDLDAKYMGFQVLNTVPMPPVSLGGYIPSSAYVDYVRRVQEADKLRQRIKEIQEGIHALTGRNEGEETAIRTKILMDTELDSLEFGLALHSYGDSYAHRRMDQSGKMYANVWGHTSHAVEYDPEKECIPNFGTPGRMFASYLVCTFVHDPHEPDHISSRKRLYREYGTGLFLILQKKLPNAPRKLDEAGLGDKLDEVSQLTNEPAQIAKLRSIAASFNLPMDAYAPESEAKGDTISWDAYNKLHPEFSAWTLPKSQQAAQQWTYPTK